MDRFEIKQAAATRDLALYKELAPKNCEYDTKKKMYIYSESFVPYCPIKPHQALSQLANGFLTEKSDINYDPFIPCETPYILSEPKNEIISIITRAIKQNRIIQMSYKSIKSGTSNKIFAPMALVSNGLRWHVRGFDREREEFSDCVLTRIVNPCIINEPPQKHETKDFDNQWNRIVELELRPHPSLNNPDGVIADYNMIEGIKKINLRAALVGYYLRLWNVDCSPKHNSRHTDKGEEFGKEFQLCLGNLQALYGVKNAELAPGYVCSL